MHFCRLILLSERERSWSCRNGTRMLETKIWSWNIGLYLFLSCLYERCAWIASVTVFCMIGHVAKLRVLFPFYCICLCMLYFAINLLTGGVRRLAAACIGASCHRGTATLHPSPSSGFSPQTTTAPAHDLAHEPECGHASVAWHHRHTHTGKEQLCPVTEIIR